MYPKTLAEISAGLANKSFSSVEITQHYLKRIDTYNKKINAFITVCHETALTQAQAADARRAQGDHTPLLGVPLAQKDLFCTQGILTTSGSKMLHNFYAPYDATVIKRFHDQGAVMLGKTNMDEFAMGSSNETSAYGAVCNPYDHTVTPGGSSGGSAAAVAADLAPGATGTDTGGSIRQPAALCNLVGLKPTYGLVSRYGMIAFASSLDQAGPMTHTAEDAAIMLSTMAGFDPLDSTSIQRPSYDYTQDLSRPVQGLRIGLIREFFEEGLDPQIAQALHTARAELEKLGVTFKEISLPSIHLSAPTYYIVAPAECSSNLARFDGIRFGHRSTEAHTLRDLYKKSRSEGFGNEVKRRIMTGTYVLSSGYYDSYYIKAQKIRSLISQEFAQAFSEVDVLMGPTTPTPAFALHAKHNDPISMYLSDIYTIAVNLAGLPALSMPAGFLGHLPIGVQLIGQHFDEGRLLSLAHQYQAVTDWHTRSPQTR